MKRSPRQDDEVLGSLESIKPLVEAIHRIGDVRAILIDPITQVSGRFNLYREDQARQFLAPLGKIAARYDLAIINVLHLVKATSRKARHRILGGVALVNASRSVLIVGKVGLKRFLMMEKANWWPEKKSVAFTMRSEGDQPVVEWETEYENVSIEDVLSGKSSHVTKQQEAGFELRNLLADGPMRSVHIKEAIVPLGISWNTVKAAKKEIGVIAKKRDDAWWWELRNET